MVDGDSQTYWSAPLDTVSSTVLLEFERLTEHISYTKIEWNFKPNQFNVLAFNQPC